MGTKYSTVTVTSYNASPPADDGSQSASNQITWAKHKTKLGDPLKTAIEAIDTALVAALNESAIAKTDTYTVTAAEHAKTIEVTTASAGCDIILLDAGTAAAGFWVNVLNAPNSTSNLRVKLATSTDLLQTVTAGTISVPPDASVTFKVNSGANGYNAINARNIALAKTKGAQFSVSASVSDGVTQNVRLSNLPAGMIMPYAGSSTPTGWLYCDGSAVSRTTYADLFTAISTTWGSGDGSTTFNLPNLNGKSLIGDGTGVVTESFSAGSVDVSAGTIVVNSNTSKWITGMAVTFSSGGSLPNLLSAGATYYVIRNTATTIKVAESLADAQNSIPTSLGSQGVGVHQIKYTLSARTLGEYGGEESHAMSSTELLSHTHTANYTGNLLYAGGGGNSNTAWSTSGANITQGINSSGGNSAMNNMSPYGVVKYVISY